MDFGICSLPIIRDSSICKNAKKIVKPKKASERSWWKVLLFGGKTGVIYGCPSDASRLTGCEINPKPKTDALSINPSSLNSNAQIVIGIPVTFELPKVTNCDGGSSNLKVTLHAGKTAVPMLKKGEVYSATISAEYWGAPITATVEDLKRGTSSTINLYSLPPVVGEVSAEK